MYVPSFSLGYLVVLIIGSAFGFVASLLEGIPIVGLFLSISNRIGAAMWYVSSDHNPTLGIMAEYRDRAFDLEKRQHLFANQVLKPLKRDEAGFFGMGAVSKVGVDIHQAEEEIEMKWSRNPQKELEVQEEKRT